MRKYFNILFCGCLFISQLCFAALELELTQGVDNAIPIVVAPFGSDDQVTPVINSDLKNSGRFRLADAGSAPIGSNIDYTVWRGQKVNAVVTGSVQQSGSQYKVTFALFDIYNQKKLAEKQYTVNGGQLRQLAHHISDIIYEQLTGDRGIFSTKIAYILVDRHGRNATYRFQVADSDGYNPRTLLTSKFPLMSPTWAPDGKKLAYVSFEGNRAAIYVQDLSSGQRRVISKAPGMNNAPAWAPDGRKMALVLTQTGYPKIYILDLASNSLERLTDGWSLDTEPNWAPDGGSIIFTSNRGGTPQIYRVYLGSKKIERVTYTGSYNARASFTPNGKNIVMLHQDSDMFNIATQELDSGRVTVLTRSGADESPSVAPNGKMIVYATSNNNRGVLAEVSLDGRVKLLLPAGEGQVQEPAWSP